SYWLSPMGSTASTPLSSGAVCLARQSPSVPSPALNAGAPGSQAMSPAAPMTGSGLAATWICRTPADSMLPALSTEKYRIVVGPVTVNGRLKTGLDIVGAELSVV